MHKFLGNISKSSKLKLTITCREGIEKLLFYWEAPFEDRTGACRRRELQQQRTDEKEKKAAVPLNMLGQMSREICTSFPIFLPTVAPHHEQKTKLPPTLEYGFLLTSLEGLVYFSGRAEKSCHAFALVVHPKETPK